VCLLKDTADMRGSITVKLLIKQNASWKQQFLKPALAILVSGEPEIREI
jgi:hypothetical protein